MGWVVGGFDVWVCWGFDLVLDFFAHFVRFVASVEM